MKSMRLPLAAIFFITYFHRARGGAMAPSAPPDLLLGTYVSNFYYDIDFNGGVIFDVVPDAARERTLNEAVILHVNNTERWFTLSAKATVIR